MPFEPQELFNDRGQLSARALEAMADQAAGVVQLALAANQHTFAGPSGVVTVPFDTSGAAFALATGNQSPGGSTIIVDAATTQIVALQPLFFTDKAPDGKAGHVTLGITLPPPVTANLFTINVQSMDPTYNGGFDEIQIDEGQGLLAKSIAPVGAGDKAAVVIYGRMTNTYSDGRGQLVGMVSAADQTFATSGGFKYVYTNQAAFHAGGFATDGVIGFGGSADTSNPDKQIRVNRDGGLLYTLGHPGAQDLNVVLATGTATMFIVLSSAGIQFTKNIGGGPNTHVKLINGTDANGVQLIGVDGTDIVGNVFTGGLCTTKSPRVAIVTGSRGGNAALTSLLQGLATIGIVIDNTTP